MDYKIVLDDFEGPLELLYKLVKKNEINISELSLARITDQYLDYLDQMREFDIDLASEFLIIAAELIEIKIKALLPAEAEAEEEESEHELIIRLREYELFKNIAQLLKEWEAEAGSRYRAQVDLEELMPEMLQLDLEISASELHELVVKAITAEKEEETEVLKNPKLEYLKEEKFNIGNKIRDILKDIRQLNQEISFFNLIKEENNQLEIVVSLLALLELMKRKRIKVVQESNFSDIRISMER
ncbi:MAG: segregation and condensation protein A [Halanaerobium sp. 4-GBenrich]|jgi:segregation and condensation protein A|uniref:Segregation and condensation protein A n=1 Tax=Halanaerobium congolense TaxID=54121 RepID=A0A1M7GZL5_9FIRM|nr:segregation/condensation protein A [Halanaerobium congolense]ODS51007.1 MAG: segregation and condensation protein A [Halanaerobium sp. 4-GBenrich]OEG62061.1 MAG: chromosome segregation protein ScpA [Halanaerobium sp. MDAL1]PUU93043.1 MAG: segregation and condensation protein A [Halanaerobium sp.]TDP27122.1 condensin subunit ScpA [Halanaerobium congolense]TDS33637.1 condensin subunit ScpA [Halanaerobium congolense]